MRVPRACLTGTFILALSGAWGGVVLAQESADPMAPAYFTFTLESVTDPAVGDEDEYSTEFTPEVRDERQVENIEATDPRASGLLTTTSNANMLEVDGIGLATAIESLQLVNDGGAWSGTAQAFHAVAEDGGATWMANLSGEGDYAGLSMAMVQYYDDDAQTRRGFILRTDQMPPAPDPIATAAGSPATLMATPTLVRYEDALGDVDGGPGPDIAAVTVSQPDAAHVSIGIGFASEPPISYSVEDDPYWTDMLDLAIGTAPDGITMGPDGPEIDFRAGLHGATLPTHLEEGVDLLAEWDTAEGVVEVSVDGPTLTLTLSRESLGDPEQLAFLVYAGREIGNGEEGGGQDIYPENDGTEPLALISWTFEEE